MKYFSSNSFAPSKILTKMLYLDISSNLPSVVIKHITLFELTELIRYGFVSELRNQEKDQSSLLNFWIVSKECFVREEFINNIKTAIDPHWISIYNTDTIIRKTNCQRRFGEEVYHWFTMHPEQANKQKLFKDQHSSIVLRKIK